VTVRGVLEAAVYADDLGAAERFYRDVLGLPVLSRQPGRHVFFRCGAGVFLVFNPDATRAAPAAPGGGHVPPHGARGPGHVAFAVGAAEVEAWRGRLAAAGVTVESEVTWPGGGRSLYVRDPAGNSVELATAQVWGLPEAP
jgi:catechol 2,3-dioxygenase-like lactoylglutathione lyase family enzyme